MPLTDHSRLNKKLDISLPEVVLDEIRSLSFRFDVSMAAVAREAIKIGLPEIIQTQTPSPDHEE